MIKIDHNCRTVIVDGVTIHPTATEFNLICFLAKHPGYKRSRVQIMDHLGIGEDSADVAVDSHVKRIRARGIRAIKTAYCVGYYWEE